MGVDKIKGYSTYNLIQMVYAYANQHILLGSYNSIFSLQNKVGSLLFPKNKKERLVTEGKYIIITIIMLALFTYILRQKTLII